MCMQACAITERVQEQNVPSWFYPAESQLEYESNNKLQIVFSSTSGARLRISLLNDPEQVDQWVVEWRITHAPNEEVSGKSVFPRSLLLAAFGIVESYIPPCGQELVSRYDADFAAIGRCIRKGDCLNIPGPGTGLAGDANLSIRLTEDVVDRMKHFLGYSEQE